TDLRNLIRQTVTFRVGKEVDATMSMRSETVDAGAAPWLFKDPGFHYAEFPTEDEARWALQRRTWDQNLLALIRTTARYARGRDQLDAATVRAAGEAYAKREVVTADTWAGTKWGRTPLLKDAEVQQLLAAPAPAPIAPAVPAVSPAWGTAPVKEIPMARE